MTSPEEDAANTLTIFVATDNHLGYAEKDPIRGKDSFVTFEEILKSAKQEAKADMVLLGGDLFHHNKPSRSTIFRTLSLFRKYCMGNGDINFRLLSDQSLNFPNFGRVNFEDPNYNIDLPVFSIHGNHDDPTRDGFDQALTTLDLLSVANLINYFGRSDSVEDIEVFPILLAKGTTKVAIYGLGNMRDERLNRMFTKQQVKFRRPAEYEDEWFNIFVIHQNRADRGRGSKNCIHESFIPEFIDLVIWGHEHECQIELHQPASGDFHLSQPGSSVATSLVEGEARTKHVAVLDVRGQQFRWRAQKLKTVRPFYFDEVVLSNEPQLKENDPDIVAKVTQFLTERVEQILERHQQEHSDNDPVQHKEILVRLKVDYSGFPMLNNQRFGSQFVGKVANPNEILLQHRRRSVRSEAALVDSVRTKARANATEGVRVETLITQNLKASDRKLMCLRENDLYEAMEDFVTKGINSAMGSCIDKTFDLTKEILTKSDSSLRTEEDIIKAVEKVNQRADVAMPVDEDNEEEDLVQQTPKAPAITPDALESEDSSKNIRKPTKASGPPASPGPSTKRKRKRSISLFSDEDSEEDVDVTQAPAVEKPASPARKSARTSSRAKSVRTKHSSPSTSQSTQMKISSLFGSQSQRSTRSTRNSTRASASQVSDIFENARDDSYEEVSQVSEDDVINVDSSSDENQHVKVPSQSQSSSSQFQSKRRLPLSMTSVSRRKLTRSESPLPSTVSEDHATSTQGSVLKNWGMLRRK